MTRLVRLLSDHKHAAILVILQVPFLVSTATSFAPLTYGWFTLWADLSKSRLPYKDFFIPFPPLGILIHGTIPNLFSNSMFVESVVECIVWIALVLALFSILRQIWPVTAAAIGTYIGSLYLFAYPVNKIAGYYESMLLFILLGLVFLLKFQNTNRHRFVYLSGFFIGGAPFIKQTAAFSCLVLSILLILAVLKSNNSKNFLILALIGITTVPFCIAAWAVGIGVFPEMLASYFAGGGKNASILRLLTWGFGGTLLSSAWWPWLTFLCGFALAFTIEKGVLNQAIPNRYFGGDRIISVTIALTFSGILSPQLLVSGVDQELVVVSFAVVWLGVIFSLLVPHSELTGTLYSKKLRILVGLNFFILLIYVLPNIGFASNPDSTSQVGQLGSTIASSLGLGSAAFTILMILAVFQPQSLFQGFFYNFELGSSNTEIGENTKFRLLCFSMTLIALALGNSLSAGATGEAWHPAFAALISSLVSIVNYRKRQGALKIVAFSCAIPLLSIFAARIVQEPYSWWATREPALSVERQSTSIRRLDGFRINESQADRWERLADLVRPSVNGQVFAGPNIGGVPYILGLASAHNNCPVLWWDVCPENLAMEDLEWLKKTRPEYILWEQQPEFVIKSHEDAFRDGSVSAIRAIGDWLTGNQGDSGYSLVATIKNDGSPDLLILHHKNK